MSGGVVGEAFSERSLHKAQAELARCLTALETGLRGAHRETLHARVLSMLPLRWERALEGERFGLSLELRPHVGVTLVICPLFFMSTLKSFEARLTALRVIERHVFLYHPTRAAHLALSSMGHDPKRFALSAHLDVLLTLNLKGEASGEPLPLPEGLSERAFKGLLRRLKLKRGMSAEAIYEALNPSQLSAQSLSELSLIQAGRVMGEGASEASLWARSPQGEPPLNLSFVKALQRELERLILMARESLSVDEVSALNTDEQRASRDVIKRNKLAPLKDLKSPQTLPELLRLSREEVERVITHLTIKEPFIGRFLASTMREVSLSVQTAAVALREQGVVLLVNPYFFMEQLEEIAERGAVLKHEALHIILHHISLIFSPQFSDKERFQVACDLEVNQMISSPWRLPEGALKPERFKLPCGLNAERYYELLGEQSRDQQARPAPSQGHHPWAQEEGGRPLYAPLPPSASQAARQKQRTIRLAKAVVDGLTSQQHGDMPGVLMEMMTPPEERVEESVDWRKALRTFATRHGRRTNAHTYRRPNRRHARLIREPLPAAQRPSQITSQGSSTPNNAQLSARADVQLKRCPLHPLPTPLLISVAREQPQLLPPLSWEALEPSARATLTQRHPLLKRAPLLTWGLLSSEALADLTTLAPSLFEELTWDQLPPQLSARAHYQRVGDELVMYERLKRAPLPALTSRAIHPSLLIIIDTSGSVSDSDLKRVFCELDALKRLGVELHVLEVDSEVQLYHRYDGLRPIAGRGGTCFEAAFKWLKEATTTGVMTPTLSKEVRASPEFFYRSRVDQREHLRVKLKVDGVVYFTDGYAMTPYTPPPCPVMWLLTPYSSDYAIADWEHTTSIVKLPKLTEGG